MTVNRFWKVRKKPTAVKSYFSAVTSLAILLKQDHRECFRENFPKSWEQMFFYATYVTYFLCNLYFCM